MSKEQINWACDTIGDLLREWKRLHDENESLKREIQQLKEKNTMHYKNGREAKNGDKVMLIPSYGAPVVGILYDAQAGNDFCNGKIAPVAPGDPCPNLQECLHLDDVLAAAAEIPDVRTALRDAEAETK